MVKAFKNMGCKSQCVFKIEGWKSYLTFTLNTKVEEGLEGAVEYLNKNPDNPQKFGLKIWGYPIWDGPRTDHVYMFCICKIERERIAIDHLYLTYGNGLKKFGTKEIDYPSLKDIPSQSELRLIKEEFTIKRKEQND